MTRACLALTFALVTTLTSVQAQTESFTARVLQDEVQELPADNTAFFTAAREVSIQLDLLAVADAGLDDSLVSVVSADGQTRNFAPDENGVIRIDNVQPGPHAIVASSKTAHGTSLMYFEEQQVADDELPLGPPTARVTMVGLQAETLQPFVNRIAHLRGSTKSLITHVGRGPVYGYRVELGPEGALHGRVLSLMHGVDPSVLVSNVGGTRISILQGGSVVRTAVADEAGDFYVSGLEQGVYGCIATGNAGFAAFAFEAVGTDALVSRESEQEYFVSKREDAAEILPVVLVPPVFIPAVFEAILGYYPELQPTLDESALATGQPVLPYGGMSSVGGGGGGGGGGAAGGGLGGLGALAGLAAIAAAASNGDDNGIIVASPAAP